MKARAPVVFLSMLPYFTCGKYSASGITKICLRPVGNESKRIENPRASSKVRFVRLYWSALRWCQGAQKVAFTARRPLAAMKCDARDAADCRNTADRITFGAERPKALADRFI